MATAHRRVCGEINSAIRVLIESGLVDDQNFAFIDRQGKNNYLVRHQNQSAITSVSRERPYADMYLEQRRKRYFNMLMLDGALLQMTYEFHYGELTRHRLVFLPSPVLLEYQNFPELYDEEVLYADVVEKHIVATPLRFDYDSRRDIAHPVVHPVSHLTLGQYVGCRIPVTAGLTPHSFVEFILNSFYRSAAETVGLRLSSPSIRFNPCIARDELRIVHISVPSYL